MNMKPKSRSVAQKPTHHHTPPPPLSYLLRVFEGELGAGVVSFHHAGAFQLEHHVRHRSQVQHLQGVGWWNG